MAGIRQPESVGGRPLGVSGLRVAAIAGRRLLDALEGECELHRVDENHPGGWLERVRPDLLLIETDGLYSERDSSRWSSDGLGELVDACRSVGVPSGVWVGDDAGHSRSPLLSRVDRVFVPDTAAAELLADRLPRRPIVVPHAASRSALRGRLPAGAGVAFVDGYGGHWPDRSEEYVESLLEAASAFGIRILAFHESEWSRLPKRFLPNVHLAPSHERTAELLRQCGALLYYGPAESLPRTVFDALGAGLHVVAPGNHLAMRVVPGLVAYLRSAEKASVELMSAMGTADEEVRRRLNRRAAINNAHTYPHRIATIASAFGTPVLPELEAAQPA